VRKTFPSFLPEIPKPLGQLELCVQLAQRTLSHVQKVDELFLRLPGTAFGDVVRNTDSARRIEGKSVSKWCVERPLPC
jgi:hypothetical protein